MSSQSGQRLRRNVSPSTKQGPMRATQQFGLLSGGSGRVSVRKISPSSSPTLIQTHATNQGQNRPASETRISCDRLSPTSPGGFKVEKPKPLRLTSSNCEIKRTGSLDTIAGPYLTGHWPRDTLLNVGLQQNEFVCVSDKQTQTPEEWHDVGIRRKSGNHKRSQSVGNGDHLNLIKQRLHTTKHSSKQNASVSQRHSPAQGSHTAMTSTPYSGHIRIPSSQCIHKLRIRGSVEGLNQEVEKLIVSGARKDAESAQIQDRTPEGRRAPVIELLAPTRSVDTQTPSSGGGGAAAEEERGGSKNSCYSSAGSRSQSVSPLSLSMPECDRNSPEPQLFAHKSSPSPRPNNNFLREPPDGCEKVELVDESKRDMSVTSGDRRQMLVFQIKSSIELRPSERSAFCALRPAVISAPTSAIMEEAN